jgi:hypothetical protein
MRRRLARTGFHKVRLDRRFADAFLPAVSQHLAKDKETHEDNHPTPEPEIKIRNHGVASFFVGRIVSSNAPTARHIGNRFWAQWCERRKAVLGG